MEKRRVTILVDGQPYSFYSDDSEEYLSELEQRANAVMNQTAAFSASSAYTNAVLSVLVLTDELLRMEQKNRETASEQKAAEARQMPGRKAPGKGAAEDRGQISVWDLLP